MALDLSQTPQDIPSHDTFGQVFSLLDSEQLKRCVLNWINAVFDKTNGQVISIDGKQVQRSYNSEDNRTAIHLVSA